VCVWCVCVVCVCVVCVCLCCVCVCCAFFGLADKLYRMHSTYIKIDESAYCQCTYVSTTVVIMVTDDDCDEPKHAAHAVLYQSVLFVYFSLIHNCLCTYLALGGEFYLATF